MASVFTYDTDLPRVSSPWLTPADSPRPPSTPQLHARSRSTSQLAEYGVTRLEAEPQEGPTEYKLHLLLRPRRTYSSSSTGPMISGSQQHKQQPSTLAANRSSPVLAPSNQSRQSRLKQLTTQLLWRLQQSTPYHASSTSDHFIVPKLPETEDGPDNASRPTKLLAGLEESRGALYEIGVSDDGTFVGLTEDEMDESLKTLRAMAASLGCNVEVVRMVIVGDCEWDETTDTDDDTAARISKPILRRQSPLWVAEALVMPDLSLEKVGSSISHGLPSLKMTEFNSVYATEQLRITLTGPTTSGKSSLLGTLSTSTLDDGRGKSRLSLLKHRHEQLSGRTSTVAQELIGYKGSEVINEAGNVTTSGNATTWADMHAAAAENGRLVFVSDSAGHPRYRRSILKGLVGWAPHWTVLCIGADDGENAPSSAGGTSSAQEILGSDGAGIDLAKAHLELCLKLDRPLSIIITKLDLASKSSLRQTLSKILSAIKASGRTPSIVTPDQTRLILETDLQTIPKSDEDKVRNIVDSIKRAKDLKSVVPIIMTSAAKGTGIQMVHALLRSLPLPNAPTAHDFIGTVALNPEQPACLFHIEDVFGVAASYQSLTSRNSLTEVDAGSVVAGHLRFGRLSIGDKLIAGPFPADLDENPSPSSRSDPRSSPASFGASLSHPSATELARIASRNISASVSKGEWHNAHVVSIRNLRLPVNTLEAGQAGTIGIVFDLPEEEQSNGPFEQPPPTAPRIRKGMVMAIPSRHMLQTGYTLQAASGFSASFEDGDINSVTPGSLVVVYIASIRASAKVLSLRPHEPNENLVVTEDQHDTDDIFRLNDAFEAEEKESAPQVFGTDGITTVTMELMTNREWIELGSQVLVMPGGGPGLYYGSERGQKGLAGLEGFVGRVTEVVD